VKEIILFYPRPWPGEKMTGRLPYPLLLLSAYLQGEMDVRVRIIDERTEPDIKASLETISEHTILFGISSFTGVQVRYAINIARELKLKFSSIPIVWGGWHPTSTVEQTLQSPYADVVVRGQGEVTLKELVLALISDADFTKIEGISYKTDAGIFHNPDRKLEPVIENVKMPLHMLDINKYVYEKPFADQSDRSIGIITSLGCPNNCAFCEVASVYKRRIFFRNIDIILEEIDFLVNEYKVNSFTIDDDNFFVSRKRTLRFCTELLNKNYKISWDAGVSVNILLSKFDDKDLKLIKASGCTQIYIGAESGSDDILALLNKRAKVADTYLFVKKMKAVGIRASISTMVGLPGVPETEIYATLDMIIKCREINPDFDYRIFFYTPYPLTALYVQALRYGLQEPRSIEEWAEYSLRRFKAPWVKKNHRNLVKYFYFYYYPYSSQLPRKITAKTWIGKILEWLDYMIFGNIILKKIATWRVNNRYFKFPIDAVFAIQGKRIESMYTKWVKKDINVFYEFDK